MSLSQAPSGWRLIEAKIIHVGSFDPDGAKSARVTSLARLNSRFASGGVRSSLDDATLFEIPPPADGVICLGDLPSDFERRRSSVLVLRANVRTMITKRAPEGLLPFCTQVETTDGSIVPFDDATRLKIGELFEEKGREGLRPLGIAWREIGPEKLFPEMRRLSFCIPSTRLRFKTLDELNAWLLDKCIAYAKAHRHPEFADRTIWEVFEAERPRLVPYAGRFDGFHAVPASISQTCLVRFDNNKYSVAAGAAVPAPARPIWPSPSPGAASAPVPAGAFTTSSTSSTVSKARPATDVRAGSPNI